MHEKPFHMSGKVKASLFVSVPLLRFHQILVETETNEWNQWNDLHLGPDVPSPAASIKNGQNGSSWNSERSIMFGNIPTPLPSSSNPSGSLGSSSQSTSIDGVSFSEGDLLLQVNHQLLMEAGVEPWVTFFLPYSGPQRLRVGGDSRGLCVLHVPDHPGLPRLPPGKTMSQKSKIFKL